MLFSFENMGVNKRLERALDKALDWQNRLEDKVEYHNNHAYYGPHKWIVCLIGSDSYSVQDFILKNKHALLKKPNLNISIMGLSSEPFELHAPDFK